ncbi:MAG: anhydro-N-acetylmuramic acid kinase [Candidatus Eisenbacteria bacterium]|uniref:Anhydro-N-acetylmuramic acid kinase n=1 Tax=Eiseniibacteriota bacterium TaxID=2212470 RepID=A0A538U9V3_UNCEI|nr:MAG: anhydro-N-acetylmuramic acid kinase [Candidatus Eisenbacteria bacterium]
MSARDDPWRALRVYRRSPEHRLVGLMTGTSGDGVDAVLVRFDGLDLDTTHRVEASLESPFAPALRHEILNVAAVESLPPERLVRLDQALGECYAAAVLELLAGAGCAPRDVEAIGMHGQTVRHVPRAVGGGQALTLQLGSAAVLAERTGISVVSDFRSRDTAAGGEGAPLVPRVDWWLFHSDRESRALLNLGGMANATYLPRGGVVDDVIGFDTGPGNAVLDGLIGMIVPGAAFDEGGRSAARGRVSEPLLEELLRDPFFAQPPPRSTGRERFGAPYAAAMRARGLALGLPGEDVLATAVALTAESVAGAVRGFLAPRGVDAVYASGGGVRNTTLMAALAERLAPIPLSTSEGLGVDASSKEALAFAFLAHQTLCGAPGNVPSATGASHPVVLGHVTPGA